jgi:phage protein D
MAEGLIIPKPYLHVELNNKDVSTWITPFLISLTYIDNDGLQKDESDDVEIEIEDSKNIFRNNPPSRGSSLKVHFGYETRKRNAGVFFIDSFSYRADRSGDIFTIKALAKDVKASYRTIKTTAFENTSLRKIAEEIAKRHDYQLDFAGEDIAFTRITQQEKRDLQFLQELCQKYGYICKISNKKLVIRSLNERLSSGVIYVLTREHILDFEFETSSLYGGEVEVVYTDAQKKETFKDKKKTQVKASGDVQKIHVRVENKTQAEKIAKAQKTINEMKEVKARLTCIGIPDLHAGGNVEVKGFGAFDRVYYIARAEHRITRNGYTTELELYRNPQEAQKK